MLERQELAGMVLGTGLTLTLVGAVGLGGSDTLNYGFMASGAAVAALAAGWWTLLRRRGL